MMRLAVIIASVVLLAALLRTAVVLHYAPRTPADTMLPDERQYLDMAAGLAAGQGLRDELGFRATRLPLYPSYLALFAGAPRGLLLALLSQAVLAASAAGCAAGLAWMVAEEVGPAPRVRPKTRSVGQDGVLGRTPCAAFRERSALLGGILVACDPFLVYAARYTLTDTLFAAALTAALLCGWPLASGPSPRRRWLACSALMALCVHLKPEAAGLVVLWAVWLAWRRRADRGVAVGLCAVAAVIVMSLFPWAARNLRETGRWTWLTHRMGISLYDGLGPQATGASDLGAIKNAAAVAGMNEVEWDRHFRQESWASVRRDPGRVLRLAVVKLGRTWRPWPAAAGHEGRWFKIIGGLWTGGILLAAVAGAARLRQRPSAIIGLLLPALYLTALHMIFVGSVRYRLPAMPMIEVLAALGSAALLNRRDSRVQQGNVV